MCYTAGPRCEVHAIEKEKALSKKTTKAFKKYDDLDKELTAETKKNPSFEDTKAGKSLLKKRSVAHQVSMKNAKELLSIQDDAYATKGGIKKIKDQIKAIDVGSTDNGIHKGFLQTRLAKAEKTYKASMDAYDVRNGTVDGRKPSTYGTPSGEKILIERGNKIYKKLKMATTDAEKKALEEKLHATMEQVEHSRMTQKAVSDGHVRVEAASLAINKMKLASVEKQFNDYRKFSDKFYSDMTAGKRSGRELGVLNSWRSDKGFSIMELNRLKNQANASIRYGKMSKKERDASDQQNSMMASAIAATYNRGAGSWTGD